MVVLSCQFGAKIVLLVLKQSIRYFVFSDDDWSESNSVPKKKKSKRNSADSALNSPQKMQKEGMLGFYKVFYM